MIRTLQKKFVITAMIAVTVLLLVVLGALNIVNTVSNKRQSEALLDDLSRQSFLDSHGGPSGDIPPEGNPAENGPLQDMALEPLPSPPPFEMLGEDDPGNRRKVFLAEPLDENARISALYFTAELDELFRIKTVDVSHIATVSEEEATTLASGFDAGQDEKGIIGSYLYKIFTLPEGGYKIVFLDNTARYTSVLRVFLLSMILGSISWLLMLALVIALSKRFIRPIAENLVRQRQFVTDAGHELKTPLAIILANVDAMELRTGESKYSRNIRTQAQRLSDLMKNLLTLARIDENSVKTYAESVDMSSLCSEVFSPFQEGAELKGIRYGMRLTENIMVKGDRSQLSQLCSILADNAVKYCSEDGEIKISLHLKERKPCLQVANTVAEVPDLDKIFDRFYRSDSSRNQSTGGFGIGLSAAQAIAEQHHAVLDAHYDDASSMLVFSVCFPTEHI